MRAYLYDEDDQWYIGKIIVQELPDSPGEYLLPIHSTLLKPMDRTAGNWQKYDFALGGWVLAPITSAEKQSIKSQIADNDREAEKLLMKILDAYARDDTNRLARLKAKYVARISGRSPD